MNYQTTCHSKGFLSNGAPPGSYYGRGVIFAGGILANAVYQSGSIGRRRMFCRGKQSREAVNRTDAGHGSRHGSAGQRRA